MRVVFDGETTKSVCPSLASADEIKIIGALSMILYATAAAATTIVTEKNARQK